MGKTYLPILLILLVAQTAWTQAKVSKVVYHCETRIGKGRAHDGTNTLYFNANKSLFIHSDYPKQDEYKDAGLTQFFVKGDTEGLPIFIDRNEKTLYFKTDYKAVKFFYIIKDTIPLIKWTIHKEVRNIGNFTCFRAQGSFGGRVYNVWFTPDIPCPFGPYKLGGLPGLILEAYSEDSMVKYTFQSYENQTNDDIKLEKPLNGKEISYQSLKEIVINQLLHAESLSTSEYTITHEDPPADFYIEKNQFTIVSEYKKTRTNKARK